MPASFSHVQSRGRSCSGARPTSRVSEGCQSAAIVPTCARNLQAPTRPYLLQARAGNVFTCMSVYHHRHCVSETHLRAGVALQLAACLQGLRAAGRCRRPWPAPAARLRHPAQLPQAGSHQSRKLLALHTPLHACCAGRDRASTCHSIRAVVGRSALAAGMRGR